MRTLRGLIAGLVSGLATVAANGATLQYLDGGFHATATAEASENTLGNVSSPLTDARGLQGVNLAASASLQQPGTIPPRTVIVASGNGNAGYAAGEGYDLLVHAEAVAYGSVLSGPFTGAWEALGTGSTGLTASVQGQGTVTKGVFFQIVPEGEESPGTPVQVFYEWQGSASTTALGTAALGAYFDKDPPDDESPQGYSAITLNQSPPVLGDPAPGLVVWQRTAASFGPGASFADTDSGEFSAAIGDVVGVFIGARATLDGEFSDGALQLSNNSARERLGFNVSVIPLPSALWLLGGALLPVVAVRKRRR